MQGEAVIADIGVTAVCPEDVAIMIDESGYTRLQIFGVGKTALSWKKMSSTTSIIREKSIPGFKEQAHLLLLADTACDLKLKLMLIYPFQKSLRIILNLCLNGSISVYKMVS